MSTEEVYHDVPTENPAKLTTYMGRQFGTDLEQDSDPLKEGIYFLTKFDVVDSQKFKKIAYLHTNKGKFRTTSANVVGSLLGAAGKTITELLKLGAPSVEIEVIPHKANTGRWGIAIKGFESNQKEESNS